ncbi:PREDICTED: beta-1,3-galactosyltransferase 2-like, partial [Mesitornis unicolor]|uniref:beta-1,3-galactosyltransferase 2-like n=1 Tax=Mesitornis unicolor TaxID=54374 RepID=UPI000528C804
GGGAVRLTLEEENSLHGDLIQQDFMDTYNNLTLKTLMGMEWVSKHCPNASYVVKADSDVFLNLNYLVAQRLSVINMEDCFVGICMHALGIGLTDSPWGMFNMYRLEYNACRFSRLVMVHHYQPDELLNI